VGDERIHGVCCEYRVMGISRENSVALRVSLDKVLKLERA
jgi:hypothetical protein